MSQNTGTKSNHSAGLVPVNNRYSILLWLFSLLFAFRVSGQAIQYWLPQSFLPPFNAFQGSRLPYWLLFTLQLAILFLMAYVTWKIQQGNLPPSAKAGTVLLSIGVIYMVGSLGRILVGLTIPTAPSWFSTWIPAIFHLVLAGFVITLALFHRQVIARTKENVA